MAKFTHNYECGPGEYQYWWEYLGWYHEESTNKEILRGRPEDDRYFCIWAKDNTVRMSNTMDQVETVVFENRDDMQQLIDALTAARDDVFPLVTNL